MHSVFVYLNQLSAHPFEAAPSSVGGKEVLLIEIIIIIF